MSAPDTPLRALVDAVLAGQATCSPDVRRAVESRAAVWGGRAGEPRGSLPHGLAVFVEKVARHAYKVTDQDIDTLRRDGYSDDQIFEIIVAAALGSGLGRLERGLGALKGG